MAMANGLKLIKYRRTRFSLFTLSLSKQGRQGHGLVWLMLLVFPFTFFLVSNKLKLSNKEEVILMTSKLYKFGLKLKKNIFLNF